MNPANILTPLVACLDPRRRFPIVNARQEVVQLLHRHKLAHQNLEDQAKGLINMIGQHRITVLSWLTYSQQSSQRPLYLYIVSHHKEPKAVRVEGTPIPFFDDAERVAILKSAAVLHRARHNTMTTALKHLCGHHKLVLDRGTHPNCSYDARITNYDGNGRDLLIEVKPDPDKGSLRIAIGQLLDYRRFLPHAAGTDLAILTITKPSRAYLTLMQDLQIIALWFTSDRCNRFKGDGKAWKPLHAIVSNSK